MKRLRIALDPQLDELRGPEIHWAWRIVLTTLGVAWVQVPLTEPCDVAFAQKPSDAPHASFCVIANAPAWMRPEAQRIQSVAQAAGLTFPVFQNDAAVPSANQIPSGQLICARDVLFDLFWLATGQSERTLPQDKHGFFNLSGSPILDCNLLRQTLASQTIKWIATRLDQLGFNVCAPRWGDGKRAAACAGHDVDYPEVIRWLEPARIVRRQGARALDAALAVLIGKRHHWQFHAWAEMEKNLRARSAFYFVARRGSFLEYARGTPDPFYDIAGENFRELFRILSSEGFEIGMQASYNAYTSREKFAREKSALEAASGVAVVGNRHHYWHLNPRDPEETLWMHEQVGLRYDTSLAHDHYLGWRRGLTHPFFPFHQKLRRELKTLQIPTGWMDDQLFGQKNLNPGDRAGLVRALADTVAEQAGCLMIDIHEYVFDDKLFPGWAATYRELWEYLGARGDYWFATPAQIAQHWSARYAQIVQSSDGLNQGMS